jgi:uncharacterized membrane protein
MSAVSAGVGKAGGARWLATGLVASLALNLVLLGATGGFVWRHRMEVLGGNPMRLAPNLLSYASTLPAERRKELWTQTEEDRRTIHPLRRDLHEARNEALEALTSDPFDHQRYRAAQARLLDADRKAREGVYKLYGEIAARLTPEERRAYLPWREQRRRTRNPLDEPDKQAGALRN